MSSDKWWEGADAVPRLRSLAHQAMQQARGEDALKLWRAILKLSPKDGDALHGIAGAHLEAGEVAEAFKACAEGARKAPEHQLMSAQAARDTSYFPSAEAPLSQLQRDPLTADLLESEKHCVQGDVGIIRQRAAVKKSESYCHITKTPIVSDDECAWVIQEAEAHATAGGGWATERHYGAPATDVPVHGCPSILRWYNGILRDRIVPLLQANFGSNLSFLCRDACVARYNAAEGQRHLNVHTDDSSHSAIIALNGGADFEGGGTYFCNIGRSLLAPKGHALVFEGGKVRHGGDPVISGIRYIIPAIFFAQPMLPQSLAVSTDIISVDEPASKKARVDSDKGATEDLVSPKPRETRGVLRKWW